MLQEPVENLQGVCDPQSLSCATSQELQDTKAIIGQARAARSLQFGLGIQALGFNIHVAGLPGTGSNFLSVEMPVSENALQRTAIFRRNTKRSSLQLYDSS